MIVQCYNDGTMRIFGRGNDALCTIICRPSLKSVADRKLKALKIKRRTKWYDYSWGSEAEVRFVR